MTYLVRNSEGAGETVRRMVPGFIVFIAELLMTLPVPLAWGVMPNFALLFVILFASIQPRLMPIWAAFLLGLFADLLWGGPLGLWTFIFSAAVAAVRLAETRVEGHSLAIDWGFAALLLLAAYLLCWRFLIFTGYDAPLVPLLAQAAITAVGYPLAALLAGRIQRRLIDVQG